MTKQRKFTEEENNNREESMIKHSPLYRYMREERGMSINEIINKLGCRWQNRYNIFMEPEDYLTFNRMRMIREMVPELSSKKFLDMLIPGDERPWYMLEDWDTRALKKKLGLD